MVHHNLTGNPELMKKLNRSLILDLVRREGPISRVEIAKRLKISSPTVSNITRSLIEENWLIEIGQKVESSSVGRKAVLLKYNAKAGYVVGAYIGEVEFHIALANLGGQIIAKRRFPLGLKGLEALEEIIREITNMLEASGVKCNDLYGIGIAVSAVTDGKNGIVLHSRYLQGWDGLPLKSIIQQKLGVPVFVDNDVRMAVLGETWAGEGQGATDLIFMTVGTGIGLGMIIGGQLHQGAHSAAGEAGDIIISESHVARAARTRNAEFRDNTSNTPDAPNTNASSPSAGTGGHFEQLAGWQALIDRAKDALRKGHDSLIASLAAGNMDALTVDAIFQAARQGDALGVSLVQDEAWYLGICIANLVSVLDPEVVILGGDIVDYKDLFLDRIRLIISELIPVMPRLTMSRLGRDAELLGSIKMALEASNGSIVIASAPLSIMAGHS